jgi:hypothetical protein
MGPLRNTAAQSLTMRAGPSVRPTGLNASAKSALAPDPAHSSVARGEFNNQDGSKTIQWSVPSSHAPAPPAVLPYTMATPLLTVVSTFPDGRLMAPVTFTLDTRYGIYSASEAHDWFLRQMRDHETFEVWDEPYDKEHQPFVFTSALIRLVRTGEPEALKKGWPDYKGNRLT